MTVTIINWDNIVDAGKKQDETEEEYGSVLSDFEEEEFEEYEIEDERTENSTTYQLADGMKKVVFYADNVRYKDDNRKLVDYDASLKKISNQNAKSDNGNSLSGYAYENKAGDMKKR